MKFTFLKWGKSSRVVMTLYQNYKNLSIYKNVKKSLYRECSIPGCTKQGKPKDRGWTVLLV